MATVTPLAAFPTQQSEYGTYSTPLLIAPSGDLLIGRVRVDGNTGARTSTIYQLAATSGGYAAELIPLATFGGTVTSLAVDAAGDVFGTSLKYAAADVNQIFEIPKTATGYAALTRLADPGTASDYAIALDAAGNILGVATGAFDSGARGPGRVFELERTVTGYGSAPTTLYTINQTTASRSSLTLDAAGNVFFLTNGAQGGYNSQLNELVKTPTGYAAAPMTLYASDFNIVSNLGGITVRADGDIFLQASGPQDTEVLLWLDRTGSGATGYAPGVVIDIEAAQYGAANPVDAPLLDARGDVFLPQAHSGVRTTSTYYGFLPGVLVAVAPQADGSYAQAVAGQAGASHSIYAFTASGSTVGFQPITNLAADRNGVLYGVTLNGGANNAGEIYRVTDAGFATAAPTNTPPVLAGFSTGQTTTDKATVSPFPTATVVDPDAGQTETVTVTYAAANGTFSGGGFTGSAGSYSASFASAAAAQAGLRTLVFTPTANAVTPGAVVTTGFTVAVSDGTATATEGTASVTATSVNDAPALGGIAASQAATAGLATSPFAQATVADPDVGQTETVTVTFAAGAGAFAGAGFSGASGVYSGTFASAAAAQAALRAATFTPAGAAASDALTVSVQDAPGGAATPATATTTLAVGQTPVNRPPTISGAVANQADAAGAAISPFAAVTVTDPDAGQSETVVVSFTAANGTLVGAGFTGAGGSYTGAFASAAAAQAALRALSFTPTAGQSASTVFTISVNDGQATATDATTSVVAMYTAPVVAPGGSGGGTATVPASVRYGLLTQFQNLERALASGADALTPGTPVYAAFQAEKAVAAQLDSGAIGLAQADAALAHLVDGTTGVAVAAYAFFTGYTPTAAGLNYLVHSTANATDLNDAYYARFTTENRYINFAVNLATGPGAGAGGFQATYGSLSLADATAKAYAAVFGATADAAKVSALLNTLVPDGLGGQETRAQYFAQYGGDGPNGQGTKAAMIGFLLSNAVHDGSGVYGAATEHYLAALAHGTAPAFGSELALSYGPAVTLVGTAPVADPAVTG